MPLIEVDFDTFKEITRRRPSEAVSEGDVVREALGLSSESRESEQRFWESDGVRFPVGLRLEHKFRNGRLAEAKVTAAGLEVDGKVYSGLSPAAVSITGHQVNGWLFWYVRDKDGRLALATSLRTDRVDR
jgi:Protein of unknown function (DUF2924)